MVKAEKLWIKKKGANEKEQIWVSCSEVDESIACYTEWSKSEREKQILYINAAYEI